MRPDTFQSRCYALLLLCLNPSLERPLLFPVGFTWSVDALGLTCKAAGSRIKRRGEGRQKGRRDPDGSGQAALRLRSGSPSYSNADQLYEIVWVRVIIPNMGKSGKWLICAG